MWENSVMHPEERRSAIADALYQQIERLAGQLDTTVPELLRHAVEQLLIQQNNSPLCGGGEWQFPEARALGSFLAPVEDWRSLANADAA